MGMDEFPGESRDVRRYVTVTMSLRSSVVSLTLDDGICPLHRMVIGFWGFLWVVGCG